MAQPDPQRPPAPVPPAPARWARLRAVLVGLSLCALLALCAWVHVHIARCHGEQSYDTATAVQYAHLARFGGGPSGVTGVSALADHVAPLYLVGVPFVWLWPGALALQLLKSAVLIVMLPALYKLAQARLGGRAGAITVAVVLLSPFFWTSVAADYHAETVAAGLIPWMLLAYDRRRLGWFLGLALLISLGKENLPLVVGGMGILALCERRPLAWWLGPGLMGALVFGVAVFVAKPFLSQGTSLHGSLFGHLGTVDGWRDALTNPQLGRWLLGLAAACGGLALLRPRTLWPLVPLLLQHGLSSYASERAFDYHYLAPLLPLLVYATIVGVERVRASWRGRLGALLLVVNLVLLFALGPLERLLSLRPVYGAARLAAEIPGEAGAWASLSTVTRLAARGRLHMAESLTLGTYVGFARPFDLADWPADEPARFGLIDVRDDRVRVPEGLAAVAAAGDIVLLRAAAQGQEPLVVPVGSAGFRFPPGGTLAGLRIRPGAGGRYEVEIQGSYPLMVHFDLEDAEGRPVDSRPHRLLYGLPEGAPGTWRGAWSTRYAPPALEPEARPQSGTYLLLLRFPGHPPIPVTTYVVGS